MRPSQVLATLALAGLASAAANPQAAAARTGTNQAAGRGQTGPGGAKWLQVVGGGDIGPQRVHTAVLAPDVSRATSAPSGPRMHVSALRSLFCSVCTVEAYQVGVFGRIRGAAPSLGVHGWAKGSGDVGAPACERVATRWG